MTCPNCDRLREALELAAKWLTNPDESATDSFERIADWFYRDTGFLRPGKSQPLEMGENADQRQEAWKSWVESKQREVYDSVRDALAATATEPESPWNEIFRPDGAAKSEVSLRNIPKDIPVPPEPPTSPRESRWDDCAACWGSGEGANDRPCSECGGTGKPREPDWEDLCEYAWGVIANAGGGNWKLETPEWQEAAARWREQFFAAKAKPRDPEGT